MNTFPCFFVTSSGASVSVYLVTRVSSVVVEGVLVRLGWVYTGLKMPPVGGASVIAVSGGIVTFLALGSIKFWSLPPTGRFLMIIFRPFGPILIIGSSSSPVDLVLGSTVFRIIVG